MTITDIANRALIDLGVPTINHIDDTERNAVLCKTVMTTAIKKVQARIHWGELIREVQLIKSKEFKFLQPKNLLSIISVNNSLDFTKEGNYIIYYSDSAICKCTIMDAKPDNWSVHLEDSIVEELKSKLCFSLTNSSQLATQVKQLAETEIANNIYKNTVNTTPCRRYCDSDWRNY